MILLCTIVALVFFFSRHCDRSYKVLADSGLWMARPAIVYHMLPYVKEVNDAEYSAVTYTVLEQLLVKITCP